jgi:hypothetical protein
MTAKVDSGLVGPRRYQIRVVGRLEPSVAEGFGDIQQRDDAEGTVLTGTMVDMSQVFGLIDYLRRLGVEVVAFDSPPSSGRSS